MRRECTADRARPILRHYLSAGTGILGKLDVEKRASRKRSFVHRLNILRELRRERSEYDLRIDI